MPFPNLRNALVGRIRLVIEEFKKRSVLGLLLIAWSLLPARAAEIEWWTAKMSWIGPRLLSPWGRVALIVCGFALIVWDYRRYKRPMGAHDLRTLSGRTRAFCEELQAFQKELGPEPKINWKPGNSATTFTEANKELIKRGQRMHHFFHLRFYDTAVHLWHEHGAEVRESIPLADALEGHIDSDEKFNEIIRMFTELAQD